MRWRARPEYTGASSSAGDNSFAGKHPAPVAISPVTSAPERRWPGPAPEPSPERVDTVETGFAPGGRMRISGLVDAGASAGHVHHECSFQTATFRSESGKVLHCCPTARDGKVLLSSQGG